MIIHQETNESAFTGGAVSYWMLGMFPTMVSVTGLVYTTEVVGEVKVLFHREHERKALFHRDHERKVLF
jgi:hypothetical protein